MRIDPDDDNDFDVNGTMIGRMRSDMTSALSELCAYFVKDGEASLSGLRKRWLSEVMKNPRGPIRVGDIQTARRLADTVSA